jgi:hypothetical protein
LQKILAGEVLFNCAITSRKKGSLFATSGLKNKSIPNRDQQLALSTYVVQPLQQNDAFLYFWIFAVQVILISVMP